MTLQKLFPETTDNLPPRLAAIANRAFAIIKGLLALIFLLIILFCTIGFILSKTNSDSNTDGHTAQSSKADVENSATDESWTLSPQIEKLGSDLKIDDISLGLVHHDVSVLSAVPVPGPDKDLAHLFKRRKLVIAQNGEASCLQRVTVHGKDRPGCLISIYVSRKRANGKYSDLAGMHAIWFRGLTDNAFKPANGWAERITLDEVAWIGPGGRIDQVDRP